MLDSAGCRFPRGNCSMPGQQGCAVGPQAAIPRPGEPRMHRAAAPTARPDLAAGVAGDPPKMWSTSSEAPFAAATESPDIVSPLPLCTY
jgi:hypothetical protein